MTKAIIFDFFGVVESGGAANGPLLRFIRDRLKPKYKIGLLSNALHNYLPEVLNDEQIALFDAVGISFEMGVAKPEPEAYKIIAERLEIEPSECVFVDDIEAFCVAAKDVGMQAIVYQDWEQVLSELEPLVK